MIVIDASVWIALALPADVHNDITFQWARSQFPLIERVHVPSLFLVEFASALARRTSSSIRAFEGVRRIRNDPTFDITPMEEWLVHGSVRIAAEQRLRAADAVYVALAQELQLPLVTWDNEQRQRSAALVEVMTPAEALASSPID